MTLHILSRTAAPRATLSVLAAALTQAAMSAGLGASSAAAQTTTAADGFAVSRQGPAAIDAALDRLADLASGSGDGPKKAFGRLYDILSQEYRDEPAFTDLRDLLREKVLSIWPVDPGTELLGTVVAERRLHSVATAAREVGIGAALMEQFLIEAGAVAEDDPRPAARRTFEAAAHASLLAKIPALVGSLTMRRAMGASRAEFTAPAEGGVLRPSTLLDVKAPWHPRDGQALVAELEGMAVPVVAADLAWESLHRAKLRTGLGVGAILTAIRAGRLQVGRHPDREGYGAFVVRRDAVDGIAPMQQTPTTEGLVPAAAFGRSIGLRDGGRFLALVAAGHTPARREVHPRTGVARFYLSPEDIARFHHRFATLPTLEAAHGQHRNTIAARLRTAGVQPFAPDGADFGPIWLREQAEAALR